MFSIITLLAISCNEKAETAEPNILHNKKTEKLDSLYTEHYKKGEFNGNVLVAENGNIIFQKSFGLTNEKTKEHKLFIQGVMERLEDE